MISITLPEETMKKKQEFNVIIEKDSAGYYVATVPSLKACHTQAKSLDILMKRVKEVIDLCLEEQRKPETSSEFIGVQRISLSP